jgi:predicted Zn finger-like uncharacterized protein
MELICPSCEARYQIPDGSIGEKGRQVSCMNCGHGWHAYPPLVLAEPLPSVGLGPATADTETAPMPSSTPDGGPQEGVGAAAMTSGMRLATGGGAAATRTDLSRTEQLAEIREMLAEVQSDQPAGTPPDQKAFVPEEQAPRSDPPPRAPQPDGLRPKALAPAADAMDEQLVEEDVLAGREESDIDPLRQRLQAKHEKTEPAKPVDVKKLRRKHERKERSRKTSKAAGSGAFMTGFLLVVMVAAVMIALYALSPQIIERMPSAEPALTKYVATIDGWRVSIAESVSNLTGWVAERADKG